MAVGLNRLVTKNLVRCYKKSCNLQIIYWAEKHIRYGPATGPEHGDFWPGINAGTKYVFSKKMKKSDPLITGWKNSEVIKNVADIKKIKNSKGPDIQVWGSSELIPLLLKNDLVDELRLKIYPLTLGKGKKILQSGTIPAAFTLTESVVTSKGVIIASYKRAGKVKTGTIEV